MYQLGIGKQEQLVALIAAAQQYVNPSDEGPVVIEATLWDRRVAQAQYCRDVPYSEYDFETREYAVRDTGKLAGLVEELLSTNRPIRTSTGHGNMVCDLVWTVKEAPTPQNVRTHPAD